MMFYQKSPDIVTNQRGSMLSIKQNQWTLTSNQDFNIPSDEDINDDTNFKDNGSLLKTADSVTKVNENVVEINDCVSEVHESVADDNEIIAEITETVENINKNVAENYNEHIDGINSNSTLPQKIITKEQSYSEQPTISKSIKLKSKNQSTEKLKFKSKRKTVEKSPKKEAKGGKRKKNLEDFKPASIVPSGGITPGVRRSNRKKFTQPVCRWNGEEKIYNSNSSLIGLKTLDEATNFKTYKIVYFNKNECPNNLNEGQENENVTILENIQSDKNESFEPTDTQKTKSITKNKTRKTIKNPDYKQTQKKQIKQKGK